MNDKDDRGKPAHEELPDRFAVEDAGDRTRLLEQLLATGGAVVLSPGSGDATPVEARLVEVDAASDRVEFEIVAGRASALGARGSNAALARASLDGVELRFELSPIGTVGADAFRMAAPLPRRLAWLQRREAFRVEPPPTAQPRLFVTVAGDTREVRILDVSATGMAFEWPGATAAPLIGTRLEGCRLELPGTPPIRCGFTVRTRFARDRAPTRLGGEFFGLDPASARSVQVYVNLAQTRALRTRPVVA